MITHNIGFYEDLTKIIFELSLNIIKYAPYFFCCSSNVKAKDLFEYQWPQESGGDWFMLQEQISTYLEVKSFKRKYPGKVIK